MNEDKKQVVTRFPPSPTGLFHVGNARTFLFNYLFTKQNNGQIVFRLEDTDKERSREEYAKDIIDNLKWLGIEPDFSTSIRQSERGGVYKKYLEKMISEGKAYFSNEKIVEEGQRDSVIRFKNPNKKIVFNDLIRGDIEFDTTELKDFIIAKSLEEPIYHLAVVVDDYEMGVSHIIRGDDGISNTPRQILIQEAIGAPRPIYAHLPLILAKDKTKLSKRKHGEKVSVTFYRNAGYLPEAIVNFLALIGWNPGDEREIFSKEELVKEFSLERIQKSAGIFNTERLDWYNGQYIRKTETKKLAEMLLEYLPENWKKIAVENYPYWIKIVELEKNRIAKLLDIKEGIGYFFSEPEYAKEILLWKPASRQGGKEPDLENTKKHLEEVVKLLSGLSEGEFSLDEIKEAVWNYAEKEGRGNVLWPMRAALTGLEKSPDPFAVAGVLGKEKTIKRLTYAIEKI